MARLPSTLIQLQHKIDALSLRERAILLVVIAVLLFMGAEQYLWLPLDQQIARAQSQLQVVQQEQQRFSQLVIDIRKGIDYDPDAEDRQGLERLEQQTAQIDGQITTAVSGLIPPDLMALALERLLQKQSLIRFISIANLPAQPLVIAGGEKSEENVALPERLSGIYRHNLEIVFEGSYEDVLTYLGELEALEWRFRWNSIDLTIQQYPAVRVRLLLHTLSLDKGLIGV